MSKLKELADLIFPNAISIEDILKRYPKRDLKESQMVVRYAPSPTGAVHIGGLYAALINKLIAKRTNGIFFLRIEDTDQEREIENGISTIYGALEAYNLKPDEGVTIENGAVKEIGEYGPYIQSQRKEIYQSFAKDLILKNKAYPCFYSKEELEEIRQNQKMAKLRTGIYGKFAKYRDMPVDLAIEKIKNNDPYILRLKSEGNPEKRLVIHDLIKGNIETYEDDQDVVIIKKDGLPTYHFAHAIDDHFMGTTLVIRGDEWVASLPLHVGLFKILGFEVPQYAHFATLMKLEDGSKRKLSKRKDKEANVVYYLKAGIPNEAVFEYLVNIANSDFEIWRRNNPDKDIMEFDFNISKFGQSGSLFDMVKLLDISKNIIAKYTKEEIYDLAYSWAEKYDEELKKMLDDKDFSLKVLNIERENTKKPRKDIAKFEDVKSNIIYMYKDKFNENSYIDIVKEIKEGRFNLQNLDIVKEEKLAKEIVKDYFENVYNISDTKEVWFEKIKDLSEKYNFAREVKDYKKEPEKYLGHVGTVSSIIRYAIVGRLNSPDIYQIFNILGYDELKRRSEIFNNLKF